MELVSSVIDVISSALVFVVGLLVCVGLARRFSVSMATSVTMYLWHTLLCFVYAQYVIINGGDAATYYESSFSLDLEFSVGTAGIKLLTYFFSSVLHLSFFGTFLAFNIFGFIGLLAFYASLKAATLDKSNNIRRLAIFIVFLPSISFWSAAIGKDALSFLAAGLALWSILELRRRASLMALSIFIMFLVRPHIAGIMVISMAVTMMFHKKVAPVQRVFVGGVALAVAALLIPFALNYSGLGGAEGASDVSEYIEQRQGYNQIGGGGIDLAGMSKPMQLFTYLFRPLPFEAHSVFSLAASLDNAVLLFVFVVGGRQMLKRRKRQKKAAFSESRVFLWVYSLSTWLILSLTTANLGISVRQKWMFAPMLIFLFISVMGRPRKNLAIRGSPALDSDGMRGRGQVRPGEAL